MSKFRGNPGKHSPAATPKEILIAGVGTLVGVGALSSVHFGLSPGDATTVLGSFGATSVLIFGYPAAPFSQPRNVIGGHMLSAFCGVCASQYLTGLLPFPWAAGPIAVSVATMAMMATRTVHPPAGGTCLLAVLGAAKFQAMGFFYLIPAGLGATSLVLIGAVFNNVYKERSYPDYWW
jgi:CBS-domain-containing membrane protein